MNEQPNKSKQEMSYVIAPQKGFEQEIKRIVAEQVQSAIHYLQEEEDVHKGVHNARRCLKVTRAAWRLIRKDLGEKDFREKNTFYRNAGRQLSELRDLTALLETLDMMQRKNKRMQKWVSQQTFRQILEEKRATAHQMESENILPHAVAKELNAHYQEINQFQLSRHFPRNVAASLRKVYARGYRALADCRQAPDPLHMHEWRKRSKYLRYHFHMLRKAWPLVFTKLEDEFHLLTDYLGDFNNLTVMKAHLNNSAYPLKTVHQEKLLQEADIHQQELWQKAIELGELLYTEAPGVFEQRMKCCLRDFFVAEN